MSDGRRYRIEGVLGKGGFGTVYRAQLLGEGGFTRAVALKVLNADMEGMEDVARRLRDEARLLGLLRHRAILHVDGLVRMQGRWTVVMEFIEGADLQKVARSGGVPLGPALEIIGEVASALHVAYTTPSPSGVPLKLLHRDIKPPNILLTSAGEVKVLDFGIARAEFGNREAQTRSVLYGSVGYMAPERLDFEELPEGDVYALGTVLYEILAGSPLGKASIRPEKHQVLVDEALDLLARKLGPLPPDFPELLGSMLAYDPEDRPSAREVERRCRSIRQHSQGPWLRDWAEKAVPPLLVHRDSLPGDDFSGSIVSESGGVTLLDDAVAEPEGASATMPFGDPSEPEPAPAPEPERVPDRPRPAPRRRGGGLGAFLTGLGLVGCLAVSGAALLVVGVLMAIALARTPGPVPVAGIGGDTAPGLDTAAPEVAPTVGGGAVAGGAGRVGDSSPSGTGSGDLSAVYGPPRGAVMRARLRQPWSGLDLPIAPGVASFNDEERLIVNYGGDQLQPLAGVWVDALAREFQVDRQYDFASDELVSATLERGRRQVVMSAAPSQGNIIVSIVVTE